MAVSGLLRMPLSEVKKNPHNFQYFRGQGYIHVGPIVPTKERPRIMGHDPVHRCYPPIGSKDLSYHFLKSPDGSTALIFQWLQGPRQWFRLDTTGHALRMGWPCEYLSSHSWTYAGPADGPHDIK